MGTDFARQPSSWLPLVAPVARRQLQRNCSVHGLPPSGEECSSCRAKRLDRQASRSALAPMMAPPIVADVLSSKGNPLDSRVTAMMGRRLGHDFSNVRVHTDPQAAESARSVGASAYTVGRDIVFGAGMYEPASSAGQKLIAHELVHVLQQGSARSPGGSDLEVAEANSRPEREADRAVAAIEAGSDRPSASKVQEAQGRLQRKVETHAGVFERTRHKPVGEPTFSPLAKYDVQLDFTPYEVADCDEIAMVQSVVSMRAGKPTYPAPEAEYKARALTSAEGPIGLRIDRRAGYRSPFYGVPNVGQPQDTHFGKKVPKQPAETAWIKDIPGVEDRVAGQTQSHDFETCAICNVGSDLGAYYGCVSWGYDIDANNVFHERDLAQVSRGTPSANLIAAAKKWNTQPVPAGRIDLPVPRYATRSENLTWAQLNAEIKSLETKQTDPNDPDWPQRAFELRVYKDVRDAIVFNRSEGFSEKEIKTIQTKVDALPDGAWGFQTVIKVKEWQTTAGMVGDGRVGPATAKKMGIRP